MGQGEAALHRNWTSGDFSTWIEEEFECQALGVTFPLSGITDMLPVERRAEVARSLSVAGNPEWVSAAEAVQLACQRPGITNGRALIVEHGRLGLLTGRAVLAQGFTGPDLETCTWETREWQMPTTFWDCVEQATDRFQEWDLSRLSAGAAINGKPEWLRASGVHILAGPLREPVAASPAQALSGAATTKGGGRPPQPWWDDLWCAVWGLINQGDFKPETQADVERAMLAWVEMNGHELSETAVKPKARKLLQAYKGEVTNFLAT